MVPGPTMARPGSTTSLGVTVNLGLAAAQIVNSNLTLTPGSATTIENVIGGSGDDVLEGGAAGNTEANVLDCGAGDDIGYSQGSAAGASKVDCEF